jgi:hypothetical protein
MYLIYPQLLIVQITLVQKTFSKVLIWILNIEFSLDKEYVRLWHSFFFIFVFFGEKKRP